MGKGSKSRAAVQTSVDCNIEGNTSSRYRSRESYNIVILFGEDSAKAGKKTIED